MIITEFLARLEGVRETSDPKWRWQARCPAHDDTDPSLSVGIGDDNCILLHCWAGCERAAILTRVGLTDEDVPARPPVKRRIILEDEDGRPSSPNRGGCTLESLADAKALPVSFLRSLGLVDISVYGQPTVRVPFCDAEGCEQSILHRVSLTGEPKFRWKSGCKQMLYGLPWLPAARAAGQIVIVEGPSDSWTLRYHNFPVIGLPSAAKWDEGWVGYFEGIDTIFVVVERDQGGEIVKKNLGRSALRDRIRFVDLGPDYKDASELYLADPARFRERLLAALNAAIPCQQVDDATAQAEAEAAWRQCEALAKSPTILDEFIADLKQRGIAGEERFAKATFLATVSRFQPRPVSIVAKGPSSAGKSIVMQKTLEFFPTRAYYAMSGMSERALAYSQEPMQYRMLVVYEAQGLQGNWASYLLRSLLSEGRIRYETVMKTEAGPQGLLIDREGPTGLLTTTTRIALHAENETRLLSVPVDDTPTQTRNVMRKVAEEGGQGVDFTRWHALQTWLAGAGHRVTIPFAETLAEIIPPVAVRLRRDFGTLLALIRAHATLHQATRNRDDAGQIVATLDDYAVVRGLVGDLMAEGVEASVPPIVRETVEAVRTLTAGVTGSMVMVKQVAAALGIDSPPALRRVRMAIERGYLKNEETRKGQPAQLVLGDPLPGDVVILPPADDPRLAEFTVTGETLGRVEPPAPWPGAPGNRNGRADEGGLPEDVDGGMLPENTVGPYDIEWGLPKQKRGPHDRVPG